MNNLEVAPKKPAIKSSPSDFFIIIKHENWKAAIEVKFNSQKLNETWNLFLIIKSYSLNTIAPCYSICLSFINLGEERIVMESLRITRFKIMSYYDFLDWWEIKINSEKKYEKKDEFLSIIFLFEPTILEIKKINLESLIPIFPWKKELLGLFKKN